MIKNGYIIERDWTLYEAQQFFSSIRHTVRHTCTDMMLKEFGQTYALHADMLSNKLLTKRELMAQMGFNDPNTFANDYKTQFADRIADSLKSKSGWNWERYGFDIYVFSLPNNNKILCEVVCGNEELLKAFTSYPYVKPYTNSSDNEQGLEDWKVATSNQASTHMNGWLVEITDKLFPNMEMEQLDMSKVPMPTVGERAKRLAETDCEMQAMKEHKDYGEVLKAKASEDYKKKVQEKIDYYLENLKPNVAKLF